MNFCKHLYFIHYNVQSTANKIDILSAELTDFDILVFSETWLHPDIHSNDLLIPEFMPPERKDRLGDRHGGVMIYVKDTLFYKRIFDLEPLNTECIWIEIHLNHTRILFGLFYRTAAASPPPPPPPHTHTHPTKISRIEDSISLALDTRIRNIIVTGDFNFNMLSDQTSKKVTDICKQFSLYQTITEPTHFTENSSSLIDIVTDPFLSQETRYSLSLPS